MNIKSVSFKGGKNRDLELNDSIGNLVVNDSFSGSSNDFKNVKNQNNKNIKNNKIDTSSNAKNQVKSSNTNLKPIEEI